MYLTLFWSLVLFSCFPRSIACPVPSTCKPPAAAKNSKIMRVQSRKQWPDRGGYCGALSIQSIALSYGAYISQDQIRKTLHDHEEMIGPINMAEALKALKFNYSMWDISSPEPQWMKYLIWMKNELRQGNPVIWFVYCHGDANVLFDHIEPVFEIYSNYSLQEFDENYHADDVLAHASDWDQNTYYRAFSSVADSMKMDGNCKDAPVGEGHNEAYPCIPKGWLDTARQLFLFLLP